MVDSKDSYVRLSAVDEQLRPHLSATLINVILTRLRQETRLPVGEELVSLDVIRQVLSEFLAPAALQAVLEKQAVVGATVVAPPDLIGDLTAFFAVFSQALTGPIRTALARVEGLLTLERARVGGESRLTLVDAQPNEGRVKDLRRALKGLLVAVGAEERTVAAVDSLLEEAHIIEQQLEALRSLKELADGLEETIEDVEEVLARWLIRKETSVEVELRELLSAILRRLALDGVIPTSSIDDLPSDTRGVVHDLVRTTARSLVNSAKERR